MVSGEDVTGYTNGALLGLCTLSATTLPSKGPHPQLRETAGRGQ